MLWLRVTMQSERIEPLKLSKTVFRVNLALYLLCMLSFTGCCSTPCADWCKNPMKQFSGPDGKQIYPGGGGKPSDVDPADIPDFPSDVTGLGEGGDSSDLPVAKCPNWCCPRGNY